MILMSSHYGNTLNLPKGKIAVILLATYFLIMMDTSITMTALNNIQIDFNLSDGTLTWVQSAYVLTFGGFLLIGSKLSDNYGFKNIFLLGNIIFLIFSILFCSLCDLQMIIKMLFKLAFNII